MIESLDEYRIPLRPVQYLADPEDHLLTVDIERAVARGIVRWIERQPAPGWWRRQIIETYQSNIATLHEWEAWQGTKDLLNINMQADRWLAGHKQYQCLWEFGADLAGEYFMQGCIWFWEVQRD